MKGLIKFAYVLVIIGGLNWLFIGFLKLDVISHLGTALAKVVYILIGLAAVVLIFSGKKSQAQ